MMSLARRVTTTVVSLALLVGPSIGIGAEQVSLDAFDMLSQVDKVFNRPEGYRSVIRLKVAGPDRVESNYLMSIVRKGSDRMLITFIEPRRVKDQVILRNGENQWIYFPKIKRTLKISIVQQLVGSDFSYGDVLNLNLKDNYTPEIIDENRIEIDTPCYLLKLTAKNKSALYNRVDYFIRQTDLAPVRRDYYTKSGKLLKTLRFGKYDNELMPHAWEMKSKLSPGNITTMTIDNINKSEIIDSIFSIQRLKNSL